MLTQCIELAIPDGAPCDDGDVCTIGDTCTDHRCAGIFNQAPPVVTAQSFLVYRPRRTRFDGNYLYVSANIGGWEKLHVIEMDPALNLGAPIAEARALDADASGSSSFSELIALDGTHKARVRTSSTGILFVDIFDTADPRAISVVATRALTSTPGTLPAPAITFVDDTLFFCSPGNELISVDVSDPALPQDAVPIATGPCAAEHSGIVAAGKFWIRWKNVWGQSDFQIFSADSTGLVSHQNHSFATHGVSQYGAINGIFIDGARGVIDLENFTRFYMLDLENQPDRFDNLSLNMQLPARALGIAGKIAYFEAGAELVAYDLTNSAAPARTAYNASLAFDLIHPTISSFSEDYLALSATDGGMAIFPRATAPAVPPAPAPRMDLRGIGALDRIHREPDGWFGYSRRARVHYSDAELRAPSLGTAPRTEIERITASIVIDSPTAPAGIYPPRLIHELDALCFAPSCEVRAGLSALVSGIGYIDGFGEHLTLHFTWPQDPQGLDVIDARGCNGVAIAGANAYSFDRCGPLNIWLPFTLPSPADRVVVHGTTATAFHSASASLLDLNTQAVLATRALEAPIGAAYEDNFWIVSPRGRILAMRHPLALIAHGRDVEIYDVSREPHRLLHSVQMPTAPMDAAIEGTSAVIAHLDGMSVLAPLCLPAQ